MLATRTIFLLLALSAMAAADGEEKTIDEVLLDALKYDYPPTACPAESGKETKQSTGSNPVDTVETLNFNTSYGILEEYDMMIPHGRTKRSAKKGALRWNNAEIPYTISSQYSSCDMKKIEDAIATFNKHTCLQWIPHNGQRDYVAIFPDQGCWSFVGRLASGRQLLSLKTPGCLGKTVTALHEFSHAAGVVHEHCRSDRDEYVRINWGNIWENMAHNFNKEDDEQYGLKYNYESIMHYGRHAFTSNGGDTMTTLDPKYQDVIGNATFFTCDDIKLLSEMYNCAENDGCGDVKCPSDNFLTRNCKCSPCEELKLASPMGAAGKGSMQGVSGITWLAVFILALQNYLSRVQERRQGLIYLSED